MWFVVCGYMLCRWTSINWTRYNRNDLNKGPKILLKKSRDRTDQYLQFESSNVFFLYGFFFYEFLKFEIALFVDLLTFVVLLNSYKL